MYIRKPADCAIVALVCLTSSQWAVGATLLSHSFSGSGDVDGVGLDGGELAGTRQWLAPSLPTETNIFDDDGVIDADRGRDGSMYVDVGDIIAPGETYFASIDVLLLQTHNEWLGFGFSPAAHTGGSAPGTAVHSTGGTLGGYAWSLNSNNNGSGTFQTFLGQATANQIGDTAVPDYSDWETIGVEIVTAADGNSFTAEYFFNGASVTPGGPAVVNQPISVLKYASISYNQTGASPDSVTIDNFVLQGPTTIPEPSTLTLVILLTAGSIATLWRSK